MLTGHGAISIQEKRRISQSRLENPLIATADGVFRSIEAIADAKELGQQATACLQAEWIHFSATPIQRHITLVATHHGAEHLSRKIQGSIVNGTLNQAGTLHQIGELFEQFVRQISASVALAGACRNGISNQLAALLAVHHHTRTRQTVAIGRRRWYGDLSCHQAVAKTGAA